jgi:hypothetical protein
MKIELLIFSSFISLLYSSNVCNLDSSLNRLLELSQRQPSLPVCIGGFSVISGRTVCNRDSSGKMRLANELDCIFPYRINGIWYETCVNIGQPFNWCSVDKDFTGRFAICEQTCPLLTRTLMSNSPGKIHSSCLSPHPQAKAYFPNEIEKKTILDIHNLIRSKVNPPATDIQFMQWDDDLARIAQRWAEFCRFGHDCLSCRVLPNKKSISVGQNAYAVWGARHDATFWTTALAALAGEIQYFRYGHGSITGNWENVAHYTYVSLFTLVNYS